LSAPRLLFMKLGAVHKIVNDFLFALHHFVPCRGRRNRRPHGADRAARASTDPFRALIISQFIAPIHRLGLRSVDMTPAR
jgi:hypothetical protein